MVETKRATLPIVRVAALAGERSRGKLIHGTAVVSCVIGPAGITHRKTEGDGATPAGRYRLRHLWFRPDRGPRPRSTLPTSGIGHRTGWCDDPGHPAYNRLVTLPFAGRHEPLWREDRLYNRLVVIDYNLRPALRNRGSAIFLHVWSSATKPTAGCVAVAPHQLRRLLPRLGSRTCIVIA